MPGSSPSLLDLDALIAALGPSACRFDVDAVAECDSTNSRLLDKATRGAPSGSVLVTDTQSAGRGRLGRVWASSPAASLTFSLLWRFPANSSAPSGLSLAIGVALARGLEHLGARGITLKWPNDVLLCRRKLAGVLVELQPGDIRSTVIGVGVNLKHPPHLPDGIEAAALDETVATIPREQVLAALLTSLCSTLDHYAASGFATLRSEWEARNAHAGAQVRISGGDKDLLGTCVGLDDDGALLLDTGQNVQRIVSGDVSLRPVP